MKNQNQSKIHILAIDPGFDRVGYAVGLLENSKLTIKEYDLIQTNKKDTLFKRYQQIQNKLLQLVEQYKIDECSIESLFFFKNQKTALTVSEARGIIIGTLLKFNVTIHEYTPLQIKQALTGYGRADKKAILKMVQLQTKLDLKNAMDDTVDALAILLTHQQSRKLKNIYD
jgi:crossover junction endodeoxyribonuclease RuvC